MKRDDSFRNERDRDTTHPSVPDRTRVGAESMRRSVKTLGQIVLGGVFFLLAGYAYFNPLYNDSGWIYSVGFYEFMFLIIGGAFVYLAYKNVRTIEGI